MNDEQRVALVFKGDPDGDSELDSAWLLREDADERRDALAASGLEAYSQSVVTRTNPWLFRPWMRPLGDTGDWWDSLT